MLELLRKGFLFPAGDMGQAVSHEMDLAALPGTTNKGFPRRFDQSLVRIRYNQPDLLDSPGFKIVEQLGVRGGGFFNHRFNRQNISFAVAVNACDHQNRHVFYYVMITDALNSIFSKGTVEFW